MLGGGGGGSVAIVHMGQWFGVDSGSGLLRLSRESPWVIATFIGGGLMWWHEESGSWACVLEEDGRV